MLEGFGKGFVDVIILWMRRLLCLDAGLVACEGLGVGFLDGRGCTSGKRTVGGGLGVLEMGFGEDGGQGFFEGLLEALRSLGLVFG